MKRCPNCGKEADDELVVCPYCHAPYSEASSRASLAPEQEQAIVGQVTRRIAKFIFGGFSILTAIAVVQIALQFASVYHAGVKQLERLLTSRIDAEFQTERIRKTVADTAAGESRTLLREQIDPEVKKFKDDIQSKVASYDQYLEELKERNRIMQLGDQAIFADRKAYEELKVAASSDKPERAAAAGAVMLQVKSFYISGTRLGDYKLDLEEFRGLTKPSSPPDPATYATTNLIAEAKTNDDWRARSKSLELLGSRHVKGVPEAVIAVAKTDQNLEVVRDAIRSFEMLTGFHSPDILEPEHIEQWWSEHGEEFAKGLQDPE